MWLVFVGTKTCGHSKKLNFQEMEKRHLKNNTYLLSGQIDICERKTDIRTDGQLIWRQGLISMRPYFLPNFSSPLMHAHLCAKFSFLKFSIFATCGITLGQREEKKKNATVAWHGVRCKTGLSRNLQHFLLTNVWIGWNKWAKKDCYWKSNSCWYKYIVSKCNICTCKK